MKRGSSRMPSQIGSTRAKSPCSPRPSMSRSSQYRAASRLPSRNTDAQEAQQNSANHGRHVPLATAGTKFSIPRGGKASVFPCSAL